MGRKNFYIRYSFFLTGILILASCEKENTEDLRDLYVGNYNGIEIYSDFQQDVNDTTSVSVFLKKFDKDTASILELDLPSTNDMYYYTIENGEIINYGSFYHCPILEIINDSLFVEWNPSSAPRKYRYIAKKESD